MTESTCGARLRLEICTNPLNLFCTRPEGHAGSHRDDPGSRWNRIDSQNITVHLARQPEELAQDKADDAMTELERRVVERIHESVTALDRYMSNRISNLEKVQQQMSSGVYTEMSVVKTMLHSFRDTVHAVQTDVSRVQATVTGGFDMSRLWTADDGVTPLCLDLSKGELNGTKYRCMRDSGHAGWHRNRRQYDAPGTMRWESDTYPGD